MKNVEKKIKRGDLGNWAVMFNQNDMCISEGKMHNCVNALPAACHPEVLSHRNAVMRYFFAFLVFLLADASNDYL